MRKPPALGTVSRAAEPGLCAIAPVCRGGGLSPHRMAVHAPPGFSRESNPQRHVIHTVLNHEQTGSSPVARQFNSGIPPTQDRSGLRHRTAFMRYLRADELHPDGFFIAGRVPGRGNPWRGAAGSAQVIDIPGEKFLPSFDTATSMQLAFERIYKFS
ncbi:hypothetical protein [Variovorax sp.]|uniref:hypothetical protein n=1 Tax=Variovorax sp. TaxID=1871043 RepID=UPI0025CEBDE9|nr:hypothetical protein [Variovorax sp.]